MSVLVDVVQVFRNFPVVAATEAVIKSVESRTEGFQSPHHLLFFTGLVLGTLVLEHVFEKPVNHLYAKTAFGLEKLGHKAGGKAGIALIMAAEVLHHTTEEEKPKELGMGELYRRAAWNIEHDRHHIIAHSSHSKPGAHHGPKQRGHAGHMGYWTPVRA
jgi:hypothetical protein